MNKRHLIFLAAGTFISFGVLLNLGIGLSTSDQAYDNASRIDDLDYRVEDVDDRVDDLERERRW